PARTTWRGRPAGPEPPPAARPLPRSATRSSSPLMRTIRARVTPVRSGTGSLPSSSRPRAFGRPGRPILSRRDTKVGYNRSHDRSDGLGPDLEIDEELRERGDGKVVRSPRPG